ncbi:hypothetical protein DFS34DRAFT_581520 [Phlyctochytrium arcticum]|nr:hypothetical protein DFS34DRAFT_581520 [Phlyctochytrium arcticum]
MPAPTTAVAPVDAQNSLLLERPRPYQLELYRKAKEQNIIAYLDTGSGKTLVSVLLIQDYATDIKVAFLVPTVALVAQQAEKIRRNTDLVVGEYSRDDVSSITRWDALGWYQEMSRRQVFVLTPQIFLNMLRHGFLDLSRDISLVVIDECHHAVKQHPYNVLMKEFYHSLPASTPRPKIFGMTASPIYQRARTHAESLLRLQELQTHLDCRVLTVTNREELQSYVPKAAEMIVEYAHSQKGINFQRITTEEESSLSICAKFYLYYMLLLADRKRAFTHVSDQVSLDKIQRSIGQLQSLEDEMGFWLAGKAACELYKQVKKNEVDPISRAQDQKGDFELEGKRAMEEAINPPSAPLLENVKHADISPKLHTLLRLVEERANGETVGENFRAMIFVERRFAARVLADCLNMVASSRFPVVKTAFVTGHGAQASRSTHGGRHSMNSTYQKKAFGRFRDGSVNTLVVTRVAEEGVDVPACKLIIVFDMFRSHTGYVQSRGRARDLRGSEFIIMVRKNNMLALQTIARAKIAEMMTRKIATDMVDKPLGNGSWLESVSKGQNDDDTTDLLLGIRDEPILSKAGASIHATAAPQLLHSYCQKALRETYLRNHQMPLEQADAPCGFLMEFTFPAGTPLAGEKVQGMIRGTKKLAQQSVALEACRELYRVGALNEHLLPNLHYKARSDGFSIAGSRTVFDAKQMRKIEEFQKPFWDMIMNHQNRFQQQQQKPNLLGKRKREKDDCVGPDGHKANDTQQQTSSPLPSHNVFEPDAAPVVETPMVDPRMYYVLPVGREGSPETSAWAFDWKATDRFTEPTSMGLYQWIAFLIQQTRAEKMPPLESLLNFETFMGFFDRCREQEFVSSSDHGLETTTLQEAELRHIEEFLRQTIVRTPHNQVKYILQSLAEDLTPHSTFNKSRSAEPMFQKSKETPSANHMVYLVPDVCDVLPLPRSFFDFAQALPSILHRVDVYCQINDFREPLALAGVELETLFSAFSAPSALEYTNYERLETLGDAFLKYAISMDVFRKNPKSDEGFLSDLRSKTVSNQNLFQRATALNLPSAMNVTPFNPRFWAPPGAPTPVMRGRRGLPTNKLGGQQDEDDFSPYASKKGNWWRLISRKMLADLVEAILGAAEVDGGHDVAMQVLVTCGLITDTSAVVKPVYMDESVTSAAGLEELELSINYKFKDRRILLQSITHTSYGTTESYQRLEFLGDAVLDWVVTRFFFNTYPQLSPAALSDLRQAAVNNESFSRMAVSLGLHKYVRHRSAQLQTDIDAYVSYLASLDDTDHPINTALEGPKALGDLYEALAAAVFTDTGYDLDQFWLVFEPIMMDFMGLHATPEVVGKSPIRQVHEHFQKLGFAVNDVSYVYV